MILRRLVSILPLIFLALSLLRWLTPEYLLQWQATIVATEYGHWLAAACLILAIFFAFAKRRVSSFILIIAMLGLSVPSIQMITHFAGWKKQLDDAFGNSLFRQPQAPNFKSLWTLSPDLPKDHETFLYRSNPNLSLDFYRAKNVPTATKSPWILVVPGGGWTEANPKTFWEFDSFLASQGYAVAVAPYRVLPEWRWPAPREDILAAITYMKAHAQELGIDPNRWVILGRSAGGQIAQSIAYDNPPEGLRGGIFFYTPADMNFAYEFSREDDMLKTGALMRSFMGGKPTDPGSFYDQASPIRFVTPHSPPTLLLHGPRDPLVWFLHSERLFKKLSENKVPSAFLQIPWATHGFDYNFSGPGGQVSSYALERFLGEALKK